MQIETCNCVTCVYQTRTHHFLSSSASRRQEVLGTSLCVYISSTETSKQWSYYMNLYLI